MPATLREVKMESRPIKEAMTEAGTSFSKISLTLDRNGIERKIASCPDQGVFYPSQNKLY